MDRKQMAEVVREQRAGFALLAQLEIEEARRATFADRLEAFRSILQFGKYVSTRDDFREEEYVASRWRKIRQRYAERCR